MTVRLHCAARGGGRAAAGPAQGPAAGPPRSAVPRLVRAAVLGRPRPAPSARSCGGLRACVPPRLGPASLVRARRGAFSSSCRRPPAAAVRGRRLQL